MEYHPVHSAPTEFMLTKSNHAATGNPTQGEAPLHRRVTERTHLLLADAASWLRIKTPQPWVRFDLRGRSAGQARLPGRGLAVIRYNPVLLAANTESFIAETVPHEVAHVIAFARYGGRIRPHGAEWQTVMEYFGVAPERCHRYEVSAGDRRALAQFDYHCDCRTHQLSNIRHRRVLAGGSYICRRCAAALRPGRAGEPDQG